MLIEIEQLNLIERLIEFFFDLFSQNHVWGSNNIVFAVLAEFEIMFLTAKEFIDISSTGKTFILEVKFDEKSHLTSFETSYC